MPDSLEFPGMRRTIVPLMRAGGAGVQECVPAPRPSFPAVIGALYELPKPSAVLRGVQPLEVDRRSFEMEYLPTGKMGASNLPLFAHCVGSENECTLARPHEDTYTAHVILSPVRRSSPYLLWTLLIRRETEVGRTAMLRPYHAARV